MAFPPVPQVPSGVRENTTPQVNLHPQDHTLIHQALTDIINELGSNPSGDAPSLTAWLQILNPVGEVKIYGGANAPSGWAICNGDQVNRTTYADLFAVIGTNYGPGDGVSTFHLPDMRAAFPAGRGPVSWAGALSSFGGNKDQFVINHSHPMDPSGGVDHLHSAGGYAGPVHDHNYGDGTQHWWLDPNAWALADGAIADRPGAGSKMGLATWHSGGGGAVTGSSGPADRGLNHTHPLQNPPGGVDGGNDRNLPPYRVFNFIIRLT